MLAVLHSVDITQRPTDVCIISVLHPGLAHATFKENKGRKVEREERKEENIRARNRGVYEMHSTFSIFISAKLYFLMSVINFLQYLFM